MLSAITGELALRTLKPLEGDCKNQNGTKIFKYLVKRHAINEFDFVNLDSTVIRILKSFSLNYE